MSNPIARENIVEHEFFLASYSHKNKSLVISLLDQLIDDGVRVWYDEDLRGGDHWLKEVERLMRHKNCRGILFFNSAESFCSKAVQEERHLAIEQTTLRQAQKEMFLIMPVNLQASNALRIFKSVFDLIEDDDKLEQHLQTVITLFPSSNIYYSLTENSLLECARKIFDDIFKSIPNAIDINKRISQELQELNNTKQINGEMALPFGVYKKVLAPSLPVEFLEQDARVFYHNKTYIVENRQTFSTEPIYWFRLYSDDQNMVLISEFILEEKYGGDSLRAWISSDFKSLAFSKEEQQLIIDLRLLTEQDLDKISRSPILSVNDSVRFAKNYWWIDSFSRGVKQKAIDPSGSVYHNGFNSHTMRKGVRPVITVPTEQFLNLFK